MFEEYQGEQIAIVYGDYDQRLADVAYYLKQALPHAANDNQRAMLECYVRHFERGDINDHMDAQRAWIKDIGPAVESNIGFIESYRDPAGVRGEFEGFVAVVNKETSRKFGVLVDQAPALLTRLPWPREFEGDRFLRPDFTSLGAFFQSVWCVYYLQTKAYAFVPPSRVSQIFCLYQR